MAIITNVIPPNSRKNTTGKPLKTFTVRYRDAAGKQREATFKTQAEAKRFDVDQAKAKQYGGDVNVKAGTELFNDVAEDYLRRLPVRAERTRETYLCNFRKHVKPAYEGKTVREAAQDVALAECLLNVAMLAYSIGPRRVARMIITGVLDWAVKAGKIDSHRVAGIKFAEKTLTEDDSEDGGFVFITDAQVEALAGRVGIAVWLQRTMGLRICEALGVEKADFINGGKTLRLKWQADRHGQKRVPLKHRRAGQYRDVPVPEFVWDMIKDMPDGPLCPGKGSRYMTYGMAWTRFRAAMTAMGIGGFTTHSLRHQFASECLEDGMNIVDLANVLGHSDPSVTLRIYVHAMPDAFDRTREMMNARWSRKPAVGLLKAA